MGYYSTRRDFLTRSIALAGLAFVGAEWQFKKEKLKLSFSTLGCPDWTFEKIVDFAVQNDYSGIEVRGIQRQMDLAKCQEFNTENSIRATLKLMKTKGLKFVDLGSSAEMHHSDATQRKKNIDEAKRFIDLADKLNCPYIRVFPNKLPKETRNETIDFIVKGLREVGDYAKASRVMVLMETHGDVVESGILKQIMDSAQHPKVGLVWDVTNMWTVTKESPTQVYEQLKKYIYHTHIKDAKLVDGNPKYKLMGRGDVPIFEAIDALQNGGYKGYYSFEWEKMWHPEIDEPEIAIADYSKTMRQHFKK
jgi:sugar phosphate isomerase/epimerase